MAGTTKFIATDTRTYLLTERRSDGKLTIFGDEQLLWLEKELQSAAEDKDVHGVVILMALSWKSPIDFRRGKTLHEKEELSVLIRRLGFNTEVTKKWLVMLSGDANVLGHDSGEYNAYGGFPLFHCGSMDAEASCRHEGWSSGPFFERG